MTGSAVMSVSTRAIVGFADTTTLPCLRLLKRGFRHCFVFLETPSGWILVDPLSHQIDTMIVHDVGAVDILRGYRSQGCHMIETRARRAPARCAPLAPLTCVEVVKRCLGIQARWVLTPWQLFRHLSDARHGCP